MGSLDYDARNVGYAWEIEKRDSFRTKDSQVGVMDTREDGLSNLGHDQKQLTIGGKAYRLDWSSQEGDDNNDANALLVYMKTL